MTSPAVGTMRILRLTPQDDRILYANLEPAMLRILITVVAVTLVGTPAAAQRFSLTFPAERSATPLDGRLLVMISADTTGEPRLQVSDGAATAQVFGVDVDGWRASTAQTVDA